MYQIFSSENWSDPLYTAVSPSAALAPRIARLAQLTWSHYPGLFKLDAEFPFHQGVIGGLFLCGWLMFSNCESRHHPLGPGHTLLG